MTYMPTTMELKEKYNDLFNTGAVRAISNWYKEEPVLNEKERGQDDFNEAQFLEKSIKNVPKLLEKLL